jgi:hypothetical protein
MSRRSKIPEAGIYPADLDLAEWRLFERLRSLRRRRQNKILLIRSEDCREIGNLPAEKKKSH